MATVGPYVQGSSGHDSDRDGVRNSRNKKDRDGDGVRNKHDRAPDNPYWR